MREINWRVRLSSPLFWAALIPAVCLLAQAVAMCFGVELDLQPVQERWLGVVDAAFGVLVVLGVVRDPTTGGMADSSKALSYEEPAANAREEAEDAVHKQNS